MSRRSKRTNSFPDKKRAKMPPVKETIVADEPSRGIFGFFRDFGVRETIESIVIAIVLALMFRASAMASSRSWLDRHDRNK